MAKEQIYTITCDNASNMVKLARIINNECEEINVIETNANDSDSNSDSDIEFEYERGEGTSLSTNDIENELFNEDFENNDNTNKEVEDLQKIVMSAIEPKSITSCIRCSVHSLQLCVLSGLKNAPIASCITEARKVVKKLRTPKYASWLKRKHLKYAVIDIETRWNSLYNMLYRLLELKEFCKLHDGTNPDVKLRDCEWESIQSVVNALNPAKTATLALQKQDLNLGDFYGIWFKAIHGLTADGSILAKTIKIAMEKELKEKYLENTTFLAGMCIFLCVPRCIILV
uniref:Zinc finger BED domain-containing protein 4 n=1 Tax=Schizaphis graminum TaxID=13262 RepID=A0A2S2P8A2_SCHGA